MKNKLAHIVVLLIILEEDLVENVMIVDTNGEIHNLAKKRQYPIVELPFLSVT